MFLQKRLFLEKKKIDFYVAGNTFTSPGTTSSVSSLLYSTIPSSFVSNRWIYFFYFVEHLIDFSIIYENEMMISVGIEVN